MAEPGLDSHSFDSGTYILNLHVMLPEEGELFKELVSSIVLGFFGLFFFFTHWSLGTHQKENLNNQSGELRLADPWQTLSLIQCLLSS